MLLAGACSQDPALLSSSSLAGHVARVQTQLWPIVPMLPASRQFGSSLTDCGHHSSTSAIHELQHLRGLNPSGYRLTGAQIFSRNRTWSLCIALLVQWTTPASLFRASLGAAVYISHKLFSFRKRFSGNGRTWTRSAWLRDSRFCH